MMPTDVPSAASLSHLDLGPRLIAAFEQEPEACAILRRVLCNTNMCDRLPWTMFGWMRDFPSLVPLRDELSRGQSRRAPVPPAPVALGPFLAWGSRQPWAQEIAWELLLGAWPRALDHTTPEDAVAAMDRALQVFVPMVPHMDPVRLGAMLPAWFDTHSAWHKPRWISIDSVPERARVWAALGWIASHAVGQETSLSQWHAQVKKSLFEMHTWDQTPMVQGLLDSPLPDAIKCRAACAGDPEGVHDADFVEQLLDAMPPNEAERFAVLPWATSARGSSAPSGSSRAYMLLEAAKVNRRTMHMFCPQLQSMLEMTNLMPVDWANRDTIARQIQAFQDAVPADTLALPQLEDA